MADIIFPVLYFTGFIAGSVIRVWYARRYRQDRKAIFREEGVVVGVLASLWGIAILMPLLYVFTGWLDFADYGLPFWAGGAGAVVFAFGLWLLWRSHADLGRNWSVTTEVKERQALVTEGVFRHLRHPMYAAHLLWGIAQLLLIPNWIAGFAGLVVFIPLYLLRVRREEKVMLDQFGEEYRRYMNRTGRVIPRLHVR
ncbi:protein-S-isoprenylcysteine O-methyltransferase [Chloroflexota bacterium]